jgi:aspartate/methionine/tyrosine aminotransferase
MITHAHTARRTHALRGSAIREMMRLAAEHGAIDLAPGIPDHQAPDVLKEAACAAIRANLNQYAMTSGTPNLRRALADTYALRYDMEVDADREVTVTCGATEAMACAMLAVLDPGDEVVVMEPCYENFAPDAELAGARIVYLPLPPPEYRVDRALLEAVVTPRTRAIVVNSPNNPTGRVFDRAELASLAAFCREHDLIALTDEIYEHLCYEGEHVPLATFPGMRERTVTISGLSKTFAVTGWRIGSIVAPPDITAAIRKVHDLLTVGAPAPLQEACAVALRELGDGYYQEMAARYRTRRDILLHALQDAGCVCTPPQGGYYIFADFAALSDEDAATFARRLVRDAGVAPVPGSGFFSTPERGRSVLRFAFCRPADVLHEAGARLRAFANRERRPIVSTREGRSAMTTLSDRDLRTYEEQGYLVIPGLLTEQEVDVLRGEIPTLIAEDTPRRVLEQDGKTVRAVHGSHQTNDIFQRLVRLPRLLGIARQVLGSDVYVHQFKINMKAAFEGDIWKWHQDYVFWLKLDGMREPRALNVFVFLDDVTEFNGPLFLVPGSHREGVIDVAAAPPEERKNDEWVASFTAALKFSIPKDTLARIVGDAGMVAPQGKRGTVLLTHCNIVHGSPPNMSPFDRWLTIVTYNSVENPLAAVREPRPEFLVSRQYDGLTPLDDDALMPAEVR